MLSRLFRRNNAEPTGLEALWHRIVAIAREPHWYARRGVADSIEGRFDMICAVLSLVLLRLEADEEQEATARLTEFFIADMDGQLREGGVGDLMVGKRMGRLMAALGGRIGAYRDGLAGSDEALAAAVRRNVTLIQERDDGQSVARGLRELVADIRTAERGELLNGIIPR